MKIAEKLLDGDGSKFVVQELHDFTPELNQASAVREITEGGVVGESRHIARLPAKLISIWLKEAGVRWDDPAARDVIKRKLLSGDASKFRVWEGSY